MIVRTKDDVLGTKGEVRTPQWSSLIYALDNHDRHRLRVHSTMRVVCTFVPPLLGGEIHDADRAYPAR
jgi:L-ectoine synthase